jgi:hypothetical protein
MATGLADERDCDEEALPAYQSGGKRRFVPRSDRSSTVRYRKANA